MSAFSACLESRRVCWQTIGTSETRARIGSVARYRSGIIEVVEKQMLGPLRRHYEAVGANRTAILKEDSDLHVCIGVTGVQYSDRFMARHERSRPRALAGNEAFRDRPILPAHGGHRLLLLCSARLCVCSCAAEPSSINLAGSTQPDHLIPSEGSTRMFRGGR